jgi:hypothetical protein
MLPHDNCLSTLHVLDAYCLLASNFLFGGEIRELIRYSRSHFSDRTGFRSQLSYWQVLASHLHWSEAFFHCTPQYFVVLHRTNFVVESIRLTQFPPKGLDSARNRKVSRVFLWCRVIHRWRRSRIDPNAETELPHPKADQSQCWQRFVSHMAGSRNPGTPVKNSLLPTVDVRLDTTQ